MTSCSSSALRSFVRRRPPTSGSTTSTTPFSSSRSSRTGRRGRIQCSRQRSGHWLHRRLRPPASPTWAHRPTRLALRSLAGPRCSHQCLGHCLHRRLHPPLGLLQPWRTIGGCVADQWRLCHLRMKLSRRRFSSRRPSPSPCGRRIQSAAKLSATRLANPMLTLRQTYPSRRQCVWYLYGRRRFLSTSSSSPSGAGPFLTMAMKPKR